MDIQGALGNFSTLSPKDAARKFLAELGYRSDKSPRGLGSTPAEFEKLFIRNQTKPQFDKEKALFGEWKSVDLIFQYTDAELSQQQELIQDNDVSASILKSYIFISIELRGSDYARGKFSSIARQINRLFPQPVMVLIKHGDRLTIAIINRRYNKLDQAKDVLGKVTLIRDINIVQPHRGHVDILTSLALPNLKHPQKKTISDFDTLHAAWEQILNVELLNQRFYRDLSNWYFWALKQVEFPADVEEEDEKRKATGLIRLLTRLIFCWFLKEKDLVPDTLFNQADLSKLLKDFDPESEKSSTYYQAILQNLFFATLNQRMGKDGNGKPYRGFAIDEGFLKNRQTYDINNLYRYEELFAVSREEILKAFEDIPFLNGGLFECLDRADETTGRKIYIDGFSRNSKKRPHVPNRLFFDSGETADLSGAYGDTKRKAERVEGLVNILQRYKFTIVENTPIDQEIALDPELLGKVFENLLASYNEETKTTARKQTGSFYTPRPIVDHMVDESLKAHLANTLVKSGHMKALDARAGLDLLFTYTEKEHAFAPDEVTVLISAIDAIKILDPACGSGAFPMGVLHKLVYILGKLDKKNERWEQLRIDEAQAIVDADERRRYISEIINNFANNNDDYGRKLYLIENCLYGVDIQPIAIQITKLRFFISLVCDQKTNLSKKENHGIRPLPNLETKFVSANTLVKITDSEIPANELDLANDAIEQLRQQLQSVRHRYFTAQNRGDRLRLQNLDKNLRESLAKELATSYANNPDATRKLAAWDPYNPQVAAEFFEPSWMFGCHLTKGFDVIIGNPPYISGEHIMSSKKLFSGRFELARGQYDIYWLFYERSLNDLLKLNGILCFINSDAMLARDETARFREWLFKKTDHIKLSHVGKVFGGVGVSAVIIALHSSTESFSGYTTIEYDNQTCSFGIEREVHFSEIRTDPKLRLQSASSPGVSGTWIARANSCIGDFYRISRGEELGKKNLTRISANANADDHVAILAGEGISRFCTPKPTHTVNKSEIKKDSSKYKSPKIVVVKTGSSFVAATDNSDLITLQSVYNLTPKSNLSCEFGCALLNSKLLNCLLKERVTGQKKLFPQITQSNILEMPVPSVSDAIQRVIVNLVHEIIDRKKAGLTSDTSSLERQIEQQIYTLYGLTTDEIAAVENA